MVRHADPLTGGPLPVPRPAPRPVVRRRVDDTPPPPEGSPPDAVLRWVGYDPDRAKAVIVAEHSRGTPDRDLIEALYERIG